MEAWGQRTLVDTFHQEYRRRQAFLPASSLADLQLQREDLALRESTAAGRTLHEPE